jgi:hypothetical protein
MPIENEQRLTQMHCKNLHIYRHREMIAVQGDGIPTFYLNAAMCHMLAKTLNDGAFSLLAEPSYSKSNFPDTQLYVGESKE